MSDQDLTRAVQQAADRSEVRSFIADLYAEVQREVETRRPICIVSGRCCKFEEYGHRLFVTTMELAAFLHDVKSLNMVRPPDDSGCPFQVNRLCGVHSIRPFGCRMFFCDETSTAWQNEAYEHFHRELKAMHISLQVPYFYVEWRAALRALHLMELSSPEGRL